MHLKKVLSLDEKNFSLLLITLSFFCYIPAISFNFIWDDFELYSKFIEINFFKLISNKLDSIYSIHFYPIFHLSHKIDYFFSKLIFINQDEKTHFTYAIIPHFTNVIIYVFSCYYFHKLTRYFFSNTHLRYISSLFFLFHPIHSNSITWISGRTDLLAGFFCIISLYFFCKLIEKQNIIDFFYLCLFYTLAVFSKIVSLTLIGPMFFILIFFYLEKKIAIKNFKLNLLFFIFCIVLFFIYFILFFKFTNVSNIETPLMFENNYFNLLSSFFKVISYYFLKLTFPFNHDIIASQLPSGANLYLGIIVFLLVFALTLFQFFIKKNSLYLLFFACIFMCLSTAFYSYYRSLNKDELITVTNLAERFAYLPSIFISLLLPYLIFEYANKFKYLVSIIFIIFFITFLAVRIPSHKDQITFAEYTHKEKRLKSHYHILSQSYDYNKNYMKLSKIFDEAIEKYPNDSKFYLKYAHLEDVNNNPKKSSLLRMKARDLHKNDTDFNYYAGVFHFNEKKYDAARGYLIIAIKNSKNLIRKSEAIILLAEIENRLNNLEEAEKLLKFVTQIDKQNSLAFFKLGKLYIKLKNKDLALKNIQKALELNPKLSKELISK